MLRFMAWIGLNLGRRVARVLLFPVCVYFFVMVPQARRASRNYLSRVLGIPAKAHHVFKHFHCFASTILDRIYLLNNRSELFELEIRSDNELRTFRPDGQGTLMFGAHLGSFEALRAIGHQSPNTPSLALLMYEANARKMSQLMSAINPDLTQEIISLGEIDSMLHVQTRIAQGAVIGMLADRTFQQDEVRCLPFLGHIAPFPLGPFRLACLLRRPLMLMIGVYQGANRYQAHFELLFDFSTPGLNRQDAIEQALMQYVSRLEYFCKRYPYNWFNFFDFWKPEHA
jgi:predicted LPLAT superfamily acyltransferase